MTTNQQNNSNVGPQRFYRHWSYTKTIRLSSKSAQMYPDIWIYCILTSCNFDLWWKRNCGQDKDLRKMHGFKLIIYALTTLIWKFHHVVLQCKSNFDKCHYIRCLRAEFAAKHEKAPLPLTMRWKMEPDFCSWQPPDISHSHLYRGTIAWTPPTAIYREYTVFSRTCTHNMQNATVINFDVIIYKDNSFPGLAAYSIGNVHINLCQYGTNWMG